MDLNNLSFKNAMVKNHKSLLLLHNIKLNRTERDVYGHKSHVIANYKQKLPYIQLNMKL